MNELNRLFTFNKKSTRAEFIGTLLFNFFIGGVGIFLADSLSEDIAGIAFFTVAVVYIWILLANYVGRMRDMGWDAWNVVFMVVPVVNIFVLLFCLFAPTKKVANRAYK